MEKSLNLISRAKNLVESARGLASISLIRPNTLQVGISQANLPQNQTTVYLRNHSLRIESDSIPTASPAGPIFTESDVVASKFSPSGGRRVVLRKKEKAVSLEVWDETGMTCSKPCESVHEPTLICLPSMAHHSIQWSQNEKRVLYLAEKKLPKKKNYGEELKTEEDIESVDQTYTYAKDMGENLDGKISIVLVLWDLNSDPINSHRLAPVSTVVDLTPEMLIPAYPQFLNEEGTEIVLGGVKYDSFKLSLVYCMNRPSAIYSVAVPLSQGEEKVTKEEKENTSKEPKKPKRWVLRKLSHEAHQVSMFPLVSQDFKAVYYHFTKNIPAMHNFYMGLARIDLTKSMELLKEVTEARNQQEGVISPDAPSKAITELFDVQQKPGETFNGFCGMPDTLERTKWLNENEFVFQGICGCDHAVYVLDLAENKVRRISPESVSSEEWVLVAAWPEEQVIFATRNTISTGVSLMAYSAKTRQWKEVSLPNLINQLPTKYAELWSPVEKNLIQGRMTKEVDGVQVEGFYFCLASAANQKPLEERRIIALFHGGPHGSISVGPTLLKRKWLEAGYVLVAMNYSGSSGYSQAFMDGLLTHNGEKDLNEIEEWILEFTRTKKMGNINDVWSYGGSYGGFLGWMILTKAQKIKFKGAAILNPVSEMNSMRLLSDISDWGCNVSLGRNTILDVTEEEVTQMSKVSPIRHLDKFEGKAGLFVGLKDRRAPAEPTLAMYRGLKELGKDIFLRVYEDNHALAATPCGVVDQVIYLSKLFEVEDQL